MLWLVDGNEYDNCVLTLLLRSYICPSNSHLPARTPAATQFDALRYLHKENPTTRSRGKGRGCVNLVHFICHSPYNAQNASCSVARATSSKPRKLSAYAHKNHFSTRRQYFCCAYICSHLCSSAMIPLATQAPLERLACSSVLVLVCVPYNFCLQYYNVLRHVKSTHSTPTGGGVHAMGPLNI